MRTCIVRAAIVLALTPVAAGAQSLSLTESEAVARATASGPRAIAIRAPIEVAKADVIAANRWPNPRGTVNRESAASITEYISTLGQVLPVTGRRGLAVDAASAHADAVASRADEETRRLRADVRLAFADLVAAQNRERELTRAAVRIRDLAGVLARREMAGDAAGFDRLRAERESRDIDADASALVIGRANAQAALAEFFTDIATMAVVAVPSNVTRSPLPSLEELIAGAEASRGALRAFQQEVTSAHLAERAAARSLFPEPEVVAGTKSSNAGAGDIGTVLAVHASIPLFDRAQPERAAARARGAQARAQADVFRSILRARITALRAEVDERRRAADRYRASFDDNADLERIAQVSYDAGERGILELLDAYRTGALGRLRQVDLDLAVRRAEIELEFVSGWEIQ